MTDYSYLSRIAALERAVEILKLALVDQASMLQKTRDELREVYRGRGPDHGGGD